MKKLILLFFFLPVFSGCAAKNEAHTFFPLSITHFNDTHTAADERYVYLDFGGRPVRVPAGGYARLIAAVKERRAQVPDGLVLFAGDAFQKGDALYETAGEEFDYTMLKEAGVNVMTVGNHEFDGGMDGFGRLLDYIGRDGSEMDVVAANLIFDDPETASKVKPYVIKNINGRKVGIAGLSVPDSFSLGHVEGLGFADSLDAARKAVGELEREGVNIIVFLTHLGFGGDMELARSVSGIDIIVGGHSHTVQGDFSAFGMEAAEKRYPLEVEGPSGGKTLIVTASSRTKNIGVIDLLFDGEGAVTGFSGNSRFLAGTGGYYSGDTPMRASEEKLMAEALKDAPFFTAIDNDTSAEAIVNSFKEKIGPAWSAVKFITDVDLNSVRDTDAPLNAMKRPGHSGLGFHMASALIMEAEAAGYDVSAAVVNSGSLKYSIPRGRVTEGRFSEAVPYVNGVVVFRIKGKALADELKKMVYYSVVTGRPNGFPCVAGIKMRYIHGNSPEKASLTNVYIRRGGKWEKLDEEKTYGITASEFIFNGGDKYGFRDKAADSAVTGYTDRDAFDSYLRLMSPVTKVEDTLEIIIP